LLRAEAILRRTGPRTPAPRRIKLGDFDFDLERAELTRQGAPVRLTESEGQLLKLLAQNAHAPVDRLDLARDTADSTGRAVDVQVTRLRRKIETDPRNPRYLQTVRGVGYMLSPDG
jgi:two-component system phosphate regulon response regulator OmpR